MIDSVLQQHLHERAWKVLERADGHCRRILEKTAAACDQFLAGVSFPLDDVCCVVVGSVGRQEALEVSDLDFVPVLSNEAALAAFDPHDKPLRDCLRAQLGIKVSKGDDLTQRIALPQLKDAESIGGTADTSNTLTRRILILTESQQAGGKLPISTVRRAIMGAYDQAERTRGRHVLSLCNDLARYYRTLCIEYKAKADKPHEAWSSRNAKLRHSRKFWYFSAILAIAHLADSNPQGNEPYVQGLLKAFSEPPFLRLFHAVEERQRGLIGRVIEPFTWFLDFMSDTGRRNALEKVTHEDRYRMALGNPFHAVKLNSDLMHQEMLALLDNLPTHQRQRALSWFLL